jgi:hypothetical protein
MNAILTTAAVLSHHPDGRAAGFPFCMVVC